MPSVVLRRSSVKPTGPFEISPQGAATRAAGAPAETFEIEMVPRNCRLQAYDPIKVPSIEVDGEIIAYCSPDSTYAVAKKLFDAAKKSILIGIYDFSADHMKELVFNALQRGVKVQLMLDIDSEKEQRFFDDLVDNGVDGTPAPSCASHKPESRYFSSSHEKVIVIDDEWCLVQSGNYSNHSIPLNVKDGGDAAHYRTGNRDTGLAIRSKKLAKFFSKVLKSDIALELEGPESVPSFAAAAEVFLVEKAPTKPPLKLFPSKTFKLSKPLTLQPVLSPDNYMSFIPGKLREARKSILIEQQYIKGSQSDIAELLEAIAAARKAAGTLDIRIILGKVFKKADLPKEKQNLALLKSEYGLALGKNIRYVDTTRLVHCHNKMILVDGKNFLISSQNWSNSAVSKNREAGIWMTHPSICGYFTQIFENDWKTALKTPEATFEETVEPESLRAGGYVSVAPADYQEV